MCKCRELRERVAWLEQVLSEADWKLRYTDGMLGAGLDSPLRRTQLRVAHDLANGLRGLEPYPYPAPGGAGSGED